MSPRASAEKDRYPSHASRYRTEGGKTCIEINLRKLVQLFDMRDPAPFIERDLDDDAVDYVVSTAEEFSHRHPIKLVLHVSEPAADSLSSAEAREAIHGYFRYQADLLRKKLDRTLRRGRVFAAVGGLFLFACLLLAELTQRIPHATVGKILREGLIITGWVALWRPIQLFLYDWMPSFEKRRLFDKLAGVEIDLHFSGANPPVERGRDRREQQAAQE